MGTGCITETLGYGGRVMLFYKPFSFAGFMMQISKSSFSSMFKITRHDSS